MSPAPQFQQRRKITTADLRAIWMRKYEEVITSARPELTGKVEWITATYYYNSGQSAVDAANMALRNM